jgi:hypothetical protein
MVLNAGPRPLKSGWPYLSVKIPATAIKYIIYKYNIIY